jgi:cytochrome c
MKKAWISSSMLLAAALIFGAATSSVMAEVPGEKIFKQQCGACHAVAANAQAGAGPNLHAVIGRDAGSMNGFKYSNEFKKGLAGKKWTPELLNSWLEDPQDIAPGTYMMYKQANEEIRKSIIDYLQTVN